MPTVTPLAPGAYSTAAPVVLEQLPVAHRTNNPRGLPLTCRPTKAMAGGLNALVAIATSRSPADVAITDNANAWRIVQSRLVHLTARSVSSVGPTKAMIGKPSSAKATSTAKPPVAASNVTNGDIASAPQFGCRQRRYLSESRPRASATIPPGPEAIATLLRVESGPTTSPILSTDVDAQDASLQRTMLLALPPHNG